MTADRNVTATFSEVPFAYTLSDDGTVSVTKSSGNAFGQSIITKNLTGGATQSVSLSLSGVPSGVSYSAANGTCSPTCSSTLTFTVSPSTAASTYPITVTGSPGGQQTSFNLVVAGAPIGVTCSATPNPASLGQEVEWSAEIDGGVAPLSYEWSGMTIPESPAPDTLEYTHVYSTIGEKTAVLTVTDSEGTVSSCDDGSVEIIFNPDFEEF